MGELGEPEDLIWVETVFGRPPRDGRRHITIVDSAWLPVGDKSAPEGAAGRLRARIGLNGVAMELELLATELSKGAGAHRPAGQRTPGYPELCVHGRSYYVVGIFAVDGA
jgi:hypothetical protein